MDWITIVFIIFFFVLPVIKQIMEAKRGKDGGTAEPGEFEHDWESIPSDRLPSERSTVRVPRPTPRVEQEMTWSDGWGQWPEPTEAETRTPVEVEPIEVVAEERSVVVPPQPDPARDEAYRRVQEALARNASIKASRPTRTPHEPSKAARVTPRTARTQRGTGLALNDPAQLRKALVLREVLGPPLALRSHEEDRASLH